MNELAKAQAELDLSRAVNMRARSNVVDAYLGLGDVDAARDHLRILRQDLGAIPPESIGGGV